MGQAGVDVRAALANLRAVTEKLNSGEGTLGKLVVDPTLYESMVSFLEGAQRSFLLRALIRSTIKTGDRAKDK
jgi:phospholipid/cholesterol/gamma-HCH transport system substrate-binding protein